MSGLESIKNTFDALSGISGRHNRALMDVRDWAASLQKFLTDYQLYGSPDINYLLENIGPAKLDLTRLVFKAKPLLKTAGKIKDNEIGKLLTEVLNQLDLLRRALINPALRQIKLDEVTSSLKVSSEQLQDKLAEIELK